jgi:hypothetical protein
MGGMASIRLWITLWIGLCVLPLAGCGVNVRKTEIAEPLTPPAEARPVPVRFGELQAKLRRGDRIGGYVIGFTCLGPFDPITWTTGREMMDHSDVADMFHEELSAAGYDVTGNPGRLFEREEDEERAELVVSAQVTDVKMNVCRKMGWWLIESDVVGEEVEASIKVDWTVYSRLDRRMVLRTSTRGYTGGGSATEDGKILAIEQAMAGAIANLAADPDFRAAAFAARNADLSVPALERGGGIGGGAGSIRKPPVDNTVPDARLKPMPTALLVDDAAKLQSVRLPPVAVFTTPIQDHVERVTGAAVLVANGSGHGSGVLVGNDGLVLTNYHVVGNAERVRVVLDDGTALTGVVERRHKVRDVALVRIEGARFPALPIRTTPLTVSEEVYAIGAPIQERLRGTVTRGIVSAFRRDRLTGLETIQADVSIQGGNSGGPLVDAQGNLAGLAVAGYVVPGGAGSAGLNLFIPIADALDRLRLEIADR